MTDSPLSGVTAAALRKLADRVSVSADVDPVICEELAGHLEDKLLDYTSGRLRPSEADALLLVERHLGEPGPLSDLLARAHGHPLPPSVVDCLITLVTATAAAFAAVDLLIATVGWTLDPHGRAGWHVAVPVEAFRWAEPVWVPAVLAWVLVRTHNPAWTRARWPRVLVAAAAVAAAFAMPMLETRPRLDTANDWPLRAMLFVDAVVRWSRLIGGLALACLWAWWGVDRSKSKRAFVVVLAGWTLAMMAAEVLRPTWMAVAPSPRDSWSVRLFWRLQAPPVSPNFSCGLPDPGTLIQVVSLLYVGRVLWQAVHPRRAAVTEQV